MGAYSCNGVLFFVRAYGFALFSLFINDWSLDFLSRFGGFALLLFCFVFRPLGAADFEGEGPLSLLPLLKNSRKNLFRGFIHPLVKKAKNLTPIFPHYAPISRHKRAQKSERDGGAYFFVSSLRIVKTRHRLQREGERRGLLFLNREREW